MMNNEEQFDSKLPIIDDEIEQSKNPSKSSRRTKIACTLANNSATIEELRMLYKAGMNIIRLNMAYATQEVLAKVCKLRNQIEKEFDCYVPIMMDLKGSIMRLGRFATPYGVLLKAGDEFRINTDEHLIGDKNIVSCDCDKLGITVEIGDKILVDYGRTSLTIKKIEKESESLAKLSELYPNDYINGFKYKSRPTLKSKTKSSSHETTDMMSSANNSETESDKNINSVTTSRKCSTELEEEQPTSGSTVNLGSQTSVSEKHRRYDRAFKSRKVKVEKDVIVCLADNDCIIKSEKPFFLYSKKNIKNYENEENLFLPKGAFVRGNSNEISNSLAGIGRKTSVNQIDEEEDDISCITVRDIKDLNAAIKHEVDVAVLSEPKKGRDIKEARFILGNNNSMRLFAKIQNAEALHNFDEILKEADGIMISRGYLSVHIPVEKLFFKQKEMIRKCHEARKPVIIVSQLLDSMVTSVVPTTSEINDISNLILDGVDILALVNETTYGQYKKEAVETLDRICNEIEQKGHNESKLYEWAYMKAPKYLKVNPFSSRTRNTENTYKNSKASISDAIVQCVVEAVDQVNASLIVCFTQTGSTVLKISKLRCHCPIIAVTTEGKIARQCSMLSSVTSIKVGSMYGRDELTKRVLETAHEKNFIKKGDYIIVSHGEIEGVPGTTNSLKIIQVKD